MERSLGDTGLYFAQRGAAADSLSNIYPLYVSATMATARWQDYVYVFRNEWGVMRFCFLVRDRRMCCQDGHVTPDECSFSAVGWARPGRLQDGYRWLGTGHDHELAILRCTAMFE